MWVGIWSEVDMAEQIWSDKELKSDQELYSTVGLHHSQQEEEEGEIGNIDLNHTLWKCKLSYC